MSTSDKHIIIGEGDEVVDSWCDGFDDPILRILCILDDSENFGVEIDWGKVIDARYNRSNPQLLDLLDDVTGMSVMNESWGGESPGRSGTWVQVSVLRTEIDAAKLELCEIADKLESNWETSGCAAKVCELKFEIDTERKRIEARTNKRIAEERKAKDEAKEQEIRGIIEIIQSELKSGKTPFFEHGHFLIAEGVVFYIIENSYYRNLDRHPWEIEREYPDERKSVQFIAYERLMDLGNTIIGVRESYPEGTDAIPIWGAAVRKTVIGWQQNKSILTSDTKSNTSLANKMRDKYINWIKKNL